jgi:hypothetical protein
MGRRGREASWRSIRRRHSPLHGVKLVILDDAHMLRTHLKQGQATLDAIKAIATELGEVGGMMILVGAWTGADSDLLDDPQIRGRLSLHQLDVL